MNRSYYLDVAAQPDLLPCGMGIGPFSLMTKLVTDPITPVFLAGSGLTGEDEPDIALTERCLAVGLDIILAYLEAQCDTGAKAIFICEPSANLVYFSPNQLEETDHAVFDKFVMEPMRKVRAMLERKNVDLLFHNCGELTDAMVSRFGTLDAAIVSLGCSRRLWEDAALIPETSVLYGNLPTKRFYSPQLTVAEVQTLSHELLDKMATVGHPFILGSECDVLSVPGSEDEIMSKVDAFFAVGKAREGKRKHPCQA